MRRSVANIDSKLLIKAYRKTKSLRELACRCEVSRATIRTVLVSQGEPILTNDEAIIFVNRQHVRVPFNRSNAEKCHMYGFVTGDVSVFRRSKFTLRAITHTTRKSFINLFTKIFGKYGSINCHITKQNDWRVFVDLDYESFKFLETRLNDTLPDWLCGDDFYAFLAGFVDADGTIILRKSGKYFQYIIKVFGENKGLLLQIKSLLEADGFHPCFYRNAIAGSTRMWREKIIRYNRDYYVLEIYRKHDTLRLLSLLPVRHEEKIARKRLLFTISNQGFCRWSDVNEAVMRLRKEQEETVALSSSV